jgi:hypothetical protein
MAVNYHSILSLEKVGLKNTVVNYCDKLLQYFLTFAPEACGQYYKLFMAVIMPLAAYFSMIFTELCR